MIQFDFEMDAESLSEAGGLDLRQTSGTDLVWGVFSMPVTLIVDGVTFLNRTRLEVLRLARDGLHKVRMLPEKRRDTLTFKPGGGLAFQMEGSEVIVTSMGMGRSSRADYAELLRSWEDFSLKVRTSLREKFPELVDHPFPESSSKMGELSSALDHVTPVARSRPSSTPTTTPATSPR